MGPIHQHPKGGRVAFYHDMNEEWAPCWAMLTPWPIVVGVV
jgi:hypothetical protein